MRQIVMEGSADCVLLISEALALATDTSENTWLDRLADMSGMICSEIAKLYAEGDSSLSDSAAESLLQAKFGEAASRLAENYTDVQQELLWYRAYLPSHADADGNTLEQGENESREDWQARIDAYFEAMKARDENRYTNEVKSFYLAATLYESELCCTDQQSEDGEKYGQESLRTYRIRRG